MTTELIEKPQAVADLALITLDPAKYVAAVFESFHTKLSAAIADADLVDLNDTTPAGLAILTKQRAVFRDDIRIAAEKARVERKAPVLLIGKLLDDENKRIKELAAPYEAKFDAAIKADEARKEATRQAKIAAERARIEAIQARIKAIREVPLNFVGKPASEISQMIGLLVDSMPGADFEEFQDEAKSVRLEVLERLGKMEQAQLDADAAAESARQEAAREAARLAEERAELDRMTAELAEATRLAKIESDRIAAEAKAENDKQVAAILAQAKIDREAKEAADALLAAERETFRRERAAFQAEKDAEAAAKQKVIDDAERARLQAEADAAALVSPVEPEPVLVADPDLSEVATPNAPTDDQIITVIADHFKVEKAIAYGWLIEMSHDLEYA